LKYIDFVVWTEKGLFIERIFPDKNFCNQNVPKVKEFFIHGILPELIGRWVSRPPTSPTQSITMVSTSTEGGSDGP